MIAVSELGILVLLLMYGTSVEGKLPEVEEAATAHRVDPKGSPSTENFAATMERPSYILMPF